MTSVQKKKGGEGGQNDYLNLKEEGETEKRVGWRGGGEGGGLRRSQGQEIVWERSRV